MGSPGVSRLAGLISEEQERAAAGSGELGGPGRWDSESCWAGELAYTKEPWNWNHNHLHLGTTDFRSITIFFDSTRSPGFFALAPSLACIVSYTVVGVAIWSRTHHLLGVTTLFAPWHHPIDPKAHVQPTQSSHRSPLALVCRSCNGEILARERT